MSTLVNQLLRGLVLRDPEVDKDGIAKNTIARRLLDYGSARDLENSNVARQREIQARKKYYESAGQGDALEGERLANAALAAQLTKQQGMMLPKDSYWQNLTEGGRSYAGSRMEKTSTPNPINPMLPPIVSERYIPAGPVLTQKEKEQAIIDKAAAYDKQEAAEQQAKFAKKQSLAKELYEQAKHLNAWAKKQFLPSGEDSFKHEPTGERRERPYFFEQATQNPDFYAEPGTMQPINTPMPSFKNENVDDPAGEGFRYAPVKKDLTNPEFLRQIQLQHNQPFYKQLFDPFNPSRRMPSFYRAPGQ